MDEMIKQKLEEETKRLYDDISRTDAGSKERSAALADALNATRLVDDLEKSEVEKAKKSEKKPKITFERVFSVVKDIVLPVGTLAFYGFCFYKGMKFEETGSFSSSTFRNFLGKAVKPK